MRRDQRRLRRIGVWLNSGRQFDPVFGVEAAVGDRAGGGAGVRVGDVGANLGGDVGAVVGGEGEPRWDVVEAQRHVQRRGRVVVAGFVPQPEMKREDAGARDRAVGEGGDAGAGGELDAGVIARRAGDPPEGAPDRARRPLVGVAPGEVEVVDPPPGFAAGQGERAGMGGRVVVDRDGAVAGAADVAGEIGDAVVDAVAAVAEVGGVDRGAAGDAGEAGLHRRRLPVAADQRLRRRGTR